MSETLKSFLNGITPEATARLMTLDESLINTPDYMGLAYFWSFTFRHDLRPVSAETRRKVHTAFRTAGLPVNGETAQHRQIVTAFTKPTDVGAITSVEFDLAHDFWRGLSEREREDFILTKNGGGPLPEWRKSNAIPVELIDPAVLEVRRLGW